AGSANTNGPVGLLPGSGCGGGGTNSASSGPMNQRFFAGGCQQANASRPPGARCPRILAKAVFGSSKNITPNWLIAASNGAPSTRSCCTSLTWNDKFLAPDAAARLRASSTSGAEMSAPTALPAPPTIAAAAVVAGPPPQPTSSTLSPGRKASAFISNGVTLSVNRSRFGQCSDQNGSFQRLRSIWLV